MKYSKAIHLIRWITFLIVFDFSLTLYSTIQLAKGKSSLITGYFTLFILPSILLPLIIYLFSAMRSSKSRK